MRFQVPQAVLHEALRAVSRAVGTRNSIPVLSGIYLCARGQRLCLRACDLGLTIQMQVAADVSQEGDLVLPAHYLVELIRRLPPGMVTISSEPGDSVGRIEGSDYEHLMHGFPGEQFPTEPVTDQQYAVAVERSGLRTLLRQVTFATSHDDSRPYLTGVALWIKGDQAQAMAADGSIIAYGEATVANPADLACALIVPECTIQELTRLLGEVPGNSCELMPLPNRLLVRLGDVSISSRLLDGAYPDFVRLLPVDYPSTVTLDRADFIGGCERALLMAQRGAIRLEGTSAGLHLLASAAEVGRTSERLPAALSGEPFAIPLDATYVLAGLKASSSPNVVMEYAGSRSAVRFRSDSSAAAFFAVMPLLSF
jgi:DNA polymerase-3 subunit beta